MKRHLYRALMGGADSMIPWGRARDAAVEAARRRSVEQLRAAIEAWEDEGGATAARNAFEASVIASPYGAPRGPGASG